MTTRYTVGQILFVVSKTETRIYPIQVVEEITKKTVEGQKTHYVVSDSNKQVELSTISGEIFESSDKMKHVLIERATESIKTLVDKVIDRASTTFTKQHFNEQYEKEHHYGVEVNEVISPGEFITLADGTLAKIKSIS